MFLAGTDSTAVALTMGIWEMMKRPNLWTRLREEIAPLLPDTETIAPLKDLETLPFLVSGNPRTPSLLRAKLTL